MADATKIEWADATFNPWWGCAEVSPGCSGAECYARTLATRYGFGGTWPAKGAAGADRAHEFRFFGDKHWAEPLKWARTLPAKLGRRPRVFCASMADVFEERPELDAPRHRLFDLIEGTPELDWLVLTKRPEFARDWLLSRYVTIFTSNQALRSCDPLLPNDVPNLWMGVSIENARFTWRADVLREIPAAVRFISAEPLLGSLFEQPREHDVVETVPNGYGGKTYAVRGRKPLDLTGIDWIIVGGSSGPRAKPFHLEHAREIIQGSRCSECGGHGWTVETATVTRTRWEQGRDGELVPVPYPEPEPYQVECARCYGTGGPAVFVKQLGAKPLENGERYAASIALGIECEHGYDVCPVCDAREMPLLLRDRKGGDWDEWPADLRIREFPRSAA